MSVVLTIGGVVVVYLIIGLAHASAISSDNLVKPGQFWTLVFCWMWKGRSAL